AVRRAVRRHAERSAQLRRLPDRLRDAGAWTAGVQQRNLRLRLRSGLGEDGERLRRRQRRQRWRWWRRQRRGGRRRRDPAVRDERRHLLEHERLLQRHLHHPHLFVSACFCTQSVTRVIACGDIVSSRSPYSSTVQRLQVWNRWLSPGSSSTVASWLPASAARIAARLSADGTCTSREPLSASTGAVTSRR